MAINDGREPTHQIFAGENEAANHIVEKHREMIFNAQRAGRQIPAVEVPMSIVGADIARPAVEASQKSMRLAGRSVFSVGRLPWKK